MMRSRFTNSDGRRCSHPLAFTSNPPLGPATRENCPSRGTDQGMIIHQLAISLMAIAVTVIIHASFMLVALGHIHRRSPRPTSALNKALVVISVVIWFFLSICLQCWAWAGLFLWLGALDSFEEALYFATVSFTTLGYGDIVLGPDWRLLGAFAATNGTIIIGWTTAMVFLAVQGIYGVGLRD